MNMTERVARAMYDATPFKETEGGYDAQSETYRSMCELLARAAIEAMREPTDAMIDAFDNMDAWDDDSRFPTASEALDSMISVALLEQAP